ncbi:endonuclease III [Sphingomonas sp.]|uniref:endonuclease III n=1 Tax=Sphingomonas sp. TaxID=28214 RepID=UPI0025F3CDDA|nr:endonuclease III [Sphingomonas sp.]MBV9528892.1 endonuclease III [Sphingomonas sp.]
MKRDEVFEFFRRLAEANPSPTTELESTNPYTLLVAVVLSAQATDASVNLAMRPVFARITRPKQMLALGEERLREAIKTIGLFNTKAKNVIALSQTLIERFGGEVPRTREELQSLPGVGRKTANVVLNTAFGEETFAVDTHVFRVCNRTGLAPGKTVDEVEAKLDRLVPQPFRRDAHHWLILHGRYTCKARLPECWRCPVVDLCRYKPKTPPPEERVKPSAARTGSRGKSATRTAKVQTASRRTANRSRSRPIRLP